MAGEVTHQSTEDIESELVRRGHVVTSWENIGEITIEATGVETCLLYTSDAADE